LETVEDGDLAKALVRKVNSFNVRVGVTGYAALIGFWILPGYVEASCLAVLWTFVGLYVVGKTMTEK
tara:strand:+ start:302 stop:502 length:201 start_codon:yes stop_codon:yes gene_type:complete